MARETLGLALIILGFVIAVIGVICGVLVFVHQLRNPPQFRSADNPPPVTAITDLVKALTALFTSLATAPVWLVLVIGGAIFMFLGGQFLPAGNEAVRNKAFSGADSLKPMITTCLEGEIATSGGWVAAGSSFNGITVSRPHTANNSSTPTGWEVQLRNTTAITANNAPNITVYVSCTSP